MPAKKQKNVKLTDKGWRLFYALKRHSGWGDTEMIENLLSMQSIAARIEVQVANELLFHNLVTRSEAATTHAAHPENITRPKRAATKKSTNGAVVIAR